jgi:hypothetical protein
MFSVLRNQKGQVSFTMNKAQQATLKPYLPVQPKQIFAGPRLSRSFALWAAR